MCRVYNSCKGEIPSCKLNRGGFFKTFPTSRLVQDYIALQDYLNGFPGHKRLKNMVSAFVAVLRLGILKSPNFFEKKLEFDQIITAQDRLEISVKETQVRGYTVALATV